MENGYIYKLTLLIDVTDMPAGSIYIGKHDGGNPYYFSGGVIVNNIRKKYGRKVFKREVIASEIESEALLSYLESYYIEKFGCNRCKTGKGLNTTDGGEGKKGNKLSDEIKKKIAETKVKKREWGIRYNTKTIYRYSADTGEYIDEFSSVTDAAEYLKVNTSSLSTRGSGKKGNVAHGFAWSYEKKDKIEIDNRRRRAILQYTLDGQLVKEWSSFSEVCKELNTDFKVIKRSIDKNSRGYKGFIWKYKSLIYNSTRWVGLERKNRAKKIPLLLTYKGKTQGLTDWSRELGISKWTIRARVKRGWATEKVFEEPIKKNKLKG